MMHTVAILSTDPHPRPYQDHSIDELFDELLLDAAHAKSLLDFSKGISTAADAKIDVRAVMAFLQSITERLQNVTDGLSSMMYELKQREQDWQTVQHLKGR